eukprot:gnl/MRDRNA2_/MRDRNA2_34649_c0_seq1.p1 gnl/MRDRNA2_/MRDRNA2_34649_c0~~gnl/MRDRNA2_/MRDRNA2_34649_c0_seq1.p1  ORF type:complete len:520 (-),score=77.16 gnl/MRDRNA2_/MRDRNA2_34649_c0_seq1:29-1588(-)
MVRLSASLASKYANLPKFFFRSDRCKSSETEILLKVSPTRPRILYGVAFFAIIGSLVLKAALWQYAALHAVDALVAFLSVITVGYNIIMEHMKEPPLRQSAQEKLDLTHCLVVLHANEPENLVYRIVEQLAHQRARGAKVLLLAMEASTKHQCAKIQTIKERFQNYFDDIIVSVHQLKEGEVVGTGSNHFEAQRVAAQYFDHPEKVILSKFDANLCIAGQNLLQEIEAHWLQSDATTRTGITFIPRVCWSMATTDSKRCTAEVSASALTNPFLCLAPYAMSFVSGSLAGAMRVGYTPPSLLAEDELLYTKKALLLESAKSCRLSTVVLKYYEEKEVSSVTFIRDMYLSKLKRWIVGWVETQDYLLRWTAGMIEGHPILSRRRVAQVLLRNTLQYYMFFVMPFNGFFCFAFGAPASIFIAVQLFIHVLIFLLTGMVQLKLYQSFDFLAIDWKTLPYLLAGSQTLYPILPWYMLYIFIKHSIRDKPVAHTPPPSTSSTKGNWSKPLSTNGMRDFQQAVTGG